MNEVMVLDGVEYKLPQWLDVGASFFVPSLDLKKTVNSVGEHYKHAKFSLHYAQWIEQGLLGVRFWREI